MDRVRKSYLRMGLFLILAGITTSSAILYFSSLKEKYDLSVTVNKLKLQLKNLDEERQNLFRELEVKKELQARLVQENTEFQENIRSIQEQMSVLSSAFKTAQARVRSLTSKIQVLQDENKVLSQEKEELNVQFSEVAQERDAMRSKFESVVELKKAIRDLKERMRLARQEIQRKMPLEEKQEVEKEQVDDGNRGFIIKDGQLTFPAYRIKIEVKPTFDTESQ